MPSKQPKDCPIQLTTDITATVSIQEKRVSNFLPISNHIFNISYLQANHPSLCPSLFYLLFTQHSILLLSHNISLLSSLSNFLIELCHSLPIQVYISSFIIHSLVLLHILFNRTSISSWYIFPIFPSFFTYKSYYLYGGFIPTTRRVFIMSFDLIVDYGVFQIL